MVLVQETMNGLCLCTQIMLTEARVQKIWSFYMGFMLHNSKAMTSTYNNLPVAYSFFTAYRTIGIRIMLAIRVSCQKIHVQAFYH